MRVYTRTGDAGTTSLANGERVLKSCARVEAYGSVDSLQAQLGMARAFAQSQDLHQEAADLEHVEERLFHVMAELAGAKDEDAVNAADVAWMEERIDAYTPQRFAFVIPGDTLPSAAMHLARTQARACERKVVALTQVEEVPALLLTYLNRLSDLLYCMAVQDA